VFEEFLVRLLNEGSARLAAPPVLADRERAAVTTVLADAFAAHALDVAGSPVAFDAAAALAAAETVATACWFLVCRDEGRDRVEKSLSLAPAADRAAIHLSADLTLRFLPAVHRRARALAVDDSLTLALGQLLRRWPLSGVLADVVEAPLTPPSLGGHPGLQLLYAERLAGNVRGNWVPGEPGRQYVELVFAERGIPLPAAAEKGVVG
jgi:hypothetical protein